MTLHTLVLIPTKWAPCTVFLKHTDISVICLVQTLWSVCVNRWLITALKCIMFLFVAPFTFFTFLLAWIPPGKLEIRAVVPKRIFGIKQGFWNSACAVNDKRVCSWWPAGNCVSLGNIWLCKNDYKRTIVCETYLTTVLIWSRQELLGEQKMLIQCNSCNIVNSTISPKCQHGLLKWNSCSATNTCLTLKTPLRQNTKLELATCRSTFHTLLGKHRPSPTNNRLSKVAQWSIAYNRIISCLFWNQGELYTDQLPRRQQSDSGDWTSRWSSADCQQWVSSSWVKCDLVSGPIRWQHCIPKPWHHRGVNMSDMSSQKTFC